MKRILTTLLIGSTLSLFAQQNLVIHTGFEFNNVQKVLNSKDNTERIRQKEIFPAINFGIDLESIWSGRITGHGGLDFNIGIPKKNDYSACIGEDSYYGSTCEDVSYQAKEKFTTIFIKYGLNIAVLGDLEDGDYALGIMGSLGYGVGLFSTKLDESLEIENAQWRENDAHSYTNEFGEVDKSGMFGYVASIGVFAQKEISDELYMFGQAKYNMTAFTDLDADNISSGKGFGINAGIKFIIW